MQLQGVTVFDYQSLLKLQIIIIIKILCFAICHGNTNSLQPDGIGSKLWLYPFSDYY